MKKILMLVIMCLFAATPVLAENWIPVNADNGKVVEIDLDSFKKSGNIVQYDVKQSKQDKIIINKLETDFANKKTAIVNESIYSNDVSANTNMRRVGFEDYSKRKVYNPIKEGTLNAALYDFISIPMECSASDVSMKVWHKYFDGLQRKMQGKWHPNTIRCSHYPKKYATAYVTLVVDRNGKILQRTYKNSTNPQPKYYGFNTRLKTQVDGVFEKVDKFKPLPKEYKGDKLIVIMRFKYSFEYDAKMEKIVFNDLGIGFLEMGKKSSALASVAQIVFMPFEIIYSIFFGPIFK